MSAFSMNTSMIDLHRIRAISEAGCSITCCMSSIPCFDTEPSIFPMEYLLFFIILLKRSFALSLISRQILNKQKYLAQYFEFDKILLTSHMCNHLVDI